MPFLIKTGVSTPAHAVQKGKKRIDCFFMACVTFTLRLMTNKCKNNDIEMTKYV